jgi:hypothetical protein
MKGFVLVLMAGMLVFSGVITGHAKEGQVFKVGAPLGLGDNPDPLPLPPGELGYDDGTPEEYWGFCGIEFAEIATLFHVDEDSTIVGARLGVSHGDLSNVALTIRFYSVSGGVPGAQIGPDVILNLPDQATQGWVWYTVEVPGIAVPAGDFFIVVHQPYCAIPAYAADTDNDSLPSEWFIYRLDTGPWTNLRAAGGPGSGPDNLYMRVILGSRQIPALSQWGIMILSVLLATSAVWIMRRRRRTA